MQEEQLILFMMRHGKSCHNVDGLDDHDRPLKPRGIVASIRAGELFKTFDETVDLVLSSTAERARHTCQLTTKHAEIAAKVLFMPRLYHASAEVLVEVLHEQHVGPGRSLMMFGHNTGYEDFVSRAVGKIVPVPTACLVKIAFTAKTWRDLRLDGRATLAGIWKAKDSD